MAQGKMISSFDNDDDAVMARLFGRLGDGQEQDPLVSRTAATGTTDRTDGATEETRSSLSPREAASTISAPTSLQRVGGIAAPSTPKEPTPLGMEGSGGASQPGDVLSRLTTTPAIYNMRRRAPMFGKAGGLMGGGLGVPQKLGTGTSEPSDLIQTILQMLGGGRRGI